MEIGDKLSGRYLLTDFIGQGGMANVFLAQDLILERQVAVKVLRFDFQDNQDAIRRFQREAMSASQLLHRNIVEIYDVEEKEDQQYIVMEYVDGTDLKTYIRQNAPLSLELVVLIMSQILSAIEVAHKNQIIHRDIKPQNILITKTGAIKITDFGIAIALSDTSITQTNTLLGSVHYLSPEQARGSNATVKSDIYALGVVLYELITGSVPFDGESAVSVALKHFQEEFPRIRDKMDYVPQSLENVVLKATAKDPANRYDSVHSMLADLSTALNASRMNEPVFVPNASGQARVQMKPIKPVKTPVAAPIEAPEPIDYDAYQRIDEVAPLDKPRRKRRIAAWLLAIISLLVICGGVYIAYTRLTEYTSVPEVAKLSKDEAVQKIQAANLQVGSIKQTWSDSIPQGQVIKSTPGSGARIRKASTVDLEISNGKEQVEIGNYVGQDYESVRSQLTAANFIVERRDFASTPEKNGKILAQSVEPGSKVVPSNTSLVFTVGKVAESTTMQDFNNLPLEMVQNFAEANGLTVDVSEDYDNDIPKGRVISQRPKYGVALSQGDTIKVTVSKGRKEEKVLTAVQRVNIEYVPKYASTDVNQRNPLPNKIQVFIGDSRNNINTLAQEFEISESRSIEILLYIMEGGVGQYRVMRDGEVIAESNEVYPNDN